MMIAAILLALRPPSTMPPEVQAATQAWARCITAPLGRPLAPGRALEEIVRAAFAGCAREEAALRVFMVRRFGAARGNREMDGLLERARQRVLGALREIAARPGPS